MGGSLVIPVTVISEAFGGISSYTQYLLNELNSDNLIKTNAIWLHNSQIKLEGNILQTFIQNGTILNLSSPNQFYHPLRRALLESSSDIIHFQYDTSFFPSHDTFLRLLAEFSSKCERKIVVTLHSVNIDSHSIQFLKNAAELVDRYIVHQSNAKTFLISEGVDSTKIVVIPHGTPVIKSLPKEMGFFKTDLFKIALTGFLKTIKAFDKALSSIINSKDLEIILAGMVKDTEAIRLINNLRRNGEAPFTLILRFLHPPELFALIAAADCIILPYQQDYYSSSGILHLAASLHKPVLVSSSPKFKEITSRIPLCEVTDLNYLKAIQTIRDTAVINRITKKMAQFAKETSWPAIAEKTIELYKELAELPR